VYAGRIGLPVGEHLVDVISVASTHEIVFGREHPHRSSHCASQVGNCCSALVDLTDQLAGARQESFARKHLFIITRY
jgi:hypothetical protein